MKTIIRLINDAYMRLDVLNNIRWERYRDNLFAMCRDEEKSHRSSFTGYAENHPQSASVADCARSFAVKRIAQYLTGDKMPTPKDYLHIQKSCFLAAGLVEEYRAEIEAAWEGLDIKSIADIDYHQLVSPEGFAQAA